MKENQGMPRLILAGEHTLLSFDTIAELIAGIVALLIVLAAIRYGRLAKDKRYNALGAGFFFLFLSFAAEWVTTSILWWQFHQGCCLQDTVALVPILLAGHAAEHLCFVTGMLVLVLWALHIKEPLQRLLVIVLGIFIAVLGIWSEPTGNLLAMILLAFVTVKYLFNAALQESAAAWEVFTAFALLTISQLAFLLAPLGMEWYIGGHVVQLLGYCILLFVLLQVIRK
jgi:hypothetical protein